MGDRAPVLIKYIHLQKKKSALSAYFPNTPNVLDKLDKFVAIEQQISHRH